MQKASREASEGRIEAYVHLAMAYRVHRARYQANLTAERWPQAVAEHDLILAALRARDSERTGALLRTHLLNKLSALSLSRTLPPDRERT